MHVLFNVKRVAFSESFLSHRRRLFTWFSLSVSASLVLVSLFLLSNSLRVPKVSVFVPKLDAVGANSSIGPCPLLPFNTSHTFSSESNTFDTTYLKKLKRKPDFSHLQIECYGQHKLVCSFSKEEHLCLLHSTEIR